MGRRGHARLITLRLSLSSTAGARQGRARITECCTRPLTSPAPLYTNTPGELGHLIAHTVLASRHTWYTTLWSIGKTHWPINRGEASAFECLQTVLKVVLWSRGAHLTKPGWSKPHIHSNPTNLTLFRHKITLYRFNQGLILLQGGSNGNRGAEPLLTLTSAYNKAATPINGT